MRLIMRVEGHHVRWWDAATGQAVPVATFQMQGPPLGRVGRWDDGVPALRLLGAPQIDVRLADGSPLAVEHVEFWLGRIGWRQYARLWWARLRWRLQRLAPPA